MKLIEGGIKIEEITFRTECAAEAIKLAVKEFPKMEIGAGKVINITQCKKAIESGAKFIVSPRFFENVAIICKERIFKY